MPNAGAPAQSDDYAEKSRHIFRIDRSGAAHIRITKIGVVPMTRRSDIIKIFAIAAKSTPPAVEKRRDIQNFKAIYGPMEYPARANWFRT